MITVTVLKNPFDYGDKEVHTCEYIPGKTAYEYVQPYIMGLDDYVVSINGEVVEDAKEQIVNSDDWIAVCPVVGKSGSDWFRAFASIIVGNVLGTVLDTIIPNSIFGSALKSATVNSIGGSLINHWFPAAKADRAKVEVDPSYNWESAHAQTGQGNALAVTYGTMRTAGQVLAQHVSSDDENQYLNILLCGGEGPIDNISDIRINDNPISYYKDISVETRLGANDQTVISNFNDTYVDQSLAYELETDGTWTMQQTAGNAVGGLEITIELPYGLYHVKDDGGLENASVSVQAQYRKVGDANWSTFTTATITAAKNTSFFRTYRIDNLTAAQYEVRLQCTSKSGTDTRYSTRVYWTQLSNIMYDDFARPGKVLLGIKALATSQLSGSMPSITWLQTRDKVWVWNAAAGQYEQKPATNPAWAAYDMIHRCRRLMNINTGNYEYHVAGAPASRMVYQDFANWAAFCHNRGLTFNYIFDTANDLWTSLQKPEGVGRGKVILRGTRFGCVCDAPGEPVQLFTVGNILTDKFKETFVSQKDRANAIEISFTNKDKGYQREVITAYADDYDAATEPNITQITLDGATTVEQAYREGKYRLRLNQHLQRTVEHSADIDAIACQINDVVLLAHDVPQWGFSGRLLAATATTLQLDREVTLEPGKSYAVAVQITNPAATTAQEAQSIVTVSVPVIAEETTTDTVTFTGSLSSVPQKWDLYSFGETNKVVKPFRVLNISWDQDLRRKITCIEYIEEVYNEATDIPEVNYSELEKTTEVSNVSVAEETYRQKDGTMVSDLNVAWSISRNKPIRGYKVLYSGDNGQTWREWCSGITALNTSIIGVKTNTTYLVKVCTINDLGVVSSGTIASVYVTGKDVPPSDVVQIAATIDPSNCTKIQLSWSAVNDIDLSGYRLYESGNVITATPINDTQYVYTAATSRQHTFSVVAIDNSGNSSSIPATISINVTVEPAQVAGFSAAIQETDRSRLMLSWQPNSEKDISYYEIRVGGDWEYGVVIATQLKAISYTHILTAEGSQNFMIKAVNIAGHASKQPASQRLQIILRPDAPTNVQAMQEPKDRTLLKLSWTASPGKDVSGCEIRKGLNWDTAEYVNFTKDTAYWYSLTESGTLNFMVKAKTVAGYLSNTANVNVTVSVEAEDVTGFTATQSLTDRTKVRLMWNQPINLETSCFEIRKGVSWDEGQIIGQRVTGTFFDYVLTSSGQHTFWIKAINVGGKYSQNPVSVSTVCDLKPSAPTNFTAVQDPSDKGKLNLLWTGISESDLLEYEVRKGLTWETAAFVASTKDTLLTVSVSTSESVRFLLKAKNTGLYYSDEVFVNTYITVEPSDVTGFQAVQNGESVLLLWNKVADPDVTGYEIREGTTFDSGSLIATGITATFHQFKVDTEITRKFHIKAINRGGKYSENAAAKTITIKNLLPKNVIAEYDEIALQTGSKTNVEFGASQFTFASLPGTFADYPTTKFSDIGGATVLKLQNVNLISDGNFASGAICSAWIGYGGTASSLSLVDDVLRITAVSAGSRGVYYDFPQTLDRSIDYVVEWEARANTSRTLTSGFTTQAEAYSGNNSTPANYSITLTADWQVFKKEYTIGASGTEPGRFLFNYGTYSVVGDWTEIKWARVYKKTDEGLFLVNQWGGGYLLSGEYQTVTKDFGQNITANIASVFVASTLLTAGTSAALYYRTKQDGAIDWDEWTLFTPAEKTFRYLEMKAVLVTTNTALTPEVNQLAIRIDVPDVSKYGDEVIPAGGAMVSYGHTYYQKVSFVPFATEAGKVAVYNGTPGLSSCPVKVLDAVTRNDVGGSITWQSTGF